MLPLIFKIYLASTKINAIILYSAFFKFISYPHNLTRRELVVSRASSSIKEKARRTTIKAGRRKSMREYGEARSDDSQHPTRATHERIDEGGYYNEIGFRLVRSRAAFIKSAISSPLSSSSFLLLFTVCEPCSSILDGDRRWTCLLLPLPLSIRFLSPLLPRTNLQWRQCSLYCLIISSIVVDWEEIKL